VAKIIEVPGSGPVNAGEQKVLDAFAARLGPLVRIYPNVLMQLKGRRFAEFDQIVLTDDRIWVIEVKDLFGQVVFHRGAHYVDGQRRSDPVATALLKAKQIKERLQLAGQGAGVFVDHRVVLAKQPKSLDIEAEYDGFVLTIDEAISVIEDPAAHGIMRRNIPVQRFNDIEVALALQPRRIDLRPRFGNIEVETLLAEEPTSRLWSAREKPLERPWLLEELVRPVDVTDSEWSTIESHAVGRVRMLQFLSGAPSIVVPQTIRYSDSGSLAIVHPVPGYPSLEELSVEVAGWPDAVRRRVLLSAARAVVTCHGKAMAHRAIGPSAIRVDAETGRAWLTEFSKVLRSGDEDHVPVSEWCVLAEGIWAAPEHLHGGPVGQEADLYAIGGLARMLWPDAPPGDLIGSIYLLTATDPSARRAGLGSLLTALGPKAAQRSVEPSAGVLWAGFRLEEQLGLAREPGVQVWRAANELTGKQVVLRIYDEDEEQNGASVLANALQGIAHDNIVQVLSAAIHQGRAFVASEFVPGPSIRTAIDQMGPLGVDPAVNAATQVLDALSRVHPGRGDDRPALLHRRVNQDNVIVDRDRGAVLVNFGPPPTMDSQVAVNEAAYRPPGEALDPDDPDVDLFAVGILLHEIATGRHPFEDADPLRGRLAIESSLDEGLKAVLSRALASDRSERFASAQEFVAALIALGLPAVELPQVADDIIATRRVIDAAVREQRWDDAEAACPVGWAPVLERIRSDRARWEAAEQNAPVLTVEGFRLRFVREEQGVTVALPGVGDVLGDDRIYLADREDGTALTIAVFRSAEGSGIVRVTEVLHGDIGLERLRQGLRIGIRPIEDGSGLTMDLRQARYVADPQPGKHPISQFLVSPEALDEGCGLDVAATLTGLGAVRFGTREEVFGENGKKRNEICVAFAKDALDLPAAVYVLTRIAPVVRGVRHGGD
jgi:hypothetical protein